jgi:ABC-type glutathione transport system ATPase component
MPARIAVSGVYDVTVEEIGMPGFVLETVTVARGNNRILDGVSERIESGRATAIVGSSGAGKSTLLRVLNRLEEPRLDGCCSTVCRFRTGTYCSCDAASVSWHSDRFCSPIKSPPRSGSALRR